MEDGDQKDSRVQGNMSDGSSLPIVEKKKSVSDSQLN